MCSWQEGIRGAKYKEDAKLKGKKRLNGRWLLSLENVGWERMSVVSRN